jgi:hypothetical protein
MIASFLWLRTKPCELESFLGYDRRLQVEELFDPDAAS